MSWPLRILNQLKQITFIIDVALLKACYFFPGLGIGAEITEFYLISINLKTNSITNSKN